MEKALIRGDIDKKWLTRSNRFKNTFLKYHRLDNYLNSNNAQTTIRFVGDAYKIIYSNCMVGISFFYVVIYFNYRSNNNYNTYDGGL